MSTFTAYLGVSLSICLLAYLCASPSICVWAYVFNVSISLNICVWACVFNVSISLNICVSVEVNLLMPRQTKIFHYQPTEECKHMLPHQQLRFLSLALFSLSLLMWERKFRYMELWCLTREYKLS